MVGELLALLEGVEVHLAWGLNPFQEIVRGKLVFLFHKHICGTRLCILVILRELVKIVFNELVIVSLANHDFPALGFSVCFCELHVIKRRIGKDRELLT